MNNKDVQDYGKIINKTVFDFIKLHGLRSNIIADDLVQSCWVKILDYNMREGHLPDFALAKKICSDNLKDFVDYSQRRTHMSYSDIEDTVVASTDDVVDESVVEELKNLFEEGSPERTYIEFYLSKAGLSDTIIPELTRQEGGYTEGALAKMLGFPSASSSRYRKFRTRMKEIIKDFFGNID